MDVGDQIIELVNILDATKAFECVKAWLFVKLSECANLSLFVQISDLVQSIVCVKPSESVNTPDLLKLDE